MKYLVQFFCAGSDFGIQTADLERALALASLLGKIQTDQVKYENIIVSPLN